MGTWVATNGESYEDLEAKVAFSSNGSTSNFAHHYTLAVTSSEALNSYIGGYIGSTVSISFGEGNGTVSATINGGAISIQKTGENSAIYSALEANAGVTATLTFGWGSDFGNETPLNYINSYTSSDTSSAIKSVASEITDFNSAVTATTGSSSITVTITPVVD